MEQTRARFIVNVAGRRSYKTEFRKRKGVDAAIFSALQPKPWPDPRYGFLGPTRDQAKRIYWDDLKRLVPPKMVRQILETELMIRLVHGVELHVIGMDKPQRFEGLGWDGVTCDEFADWKEDAFEKSVLPALADRHGWADLIGVPKGRNHLYKRAVAAQEEMEKAARDHRRPQWAFYTWHSSKVLPRAEVDEMRAELDPVTFREQFEASFEDPTGRVCYGFDRKENVREFAVPEGVKWMACMDFNVHPMTAACGWVVGDTVYVWRDWHVPTADTRVVARRVREVTGPGATMFPDPSGKARDTRSGTNDHAILQEEGFVIRARAACPSPRTRNNALNTRLHNGAGQRRLFVHPRCQHLIESLDGLVYKRNTKGEMEEEKNELQHIISALGFWVEFLFPIRPTGGMKGVRY